MLVAKIALRDSVARFDRLYSYLVPLNFASGVEPGQRILIPFGRSNRRVEGLIIELKQESDFGQAGSDSPVLKEIAEILQVEPVLHPDQLELLKNIVRRYACTWSTALRLFLPGFVRSEVKPRLVFTEAGKAVDWKNFTWPSDTDHTIFEQLILALKDHRQKVRISNLFERFSLTLRDISFLLELNYLACVDEVGSKMKAREEVLLSLRSKEEAIALLEGDKLRSIGQIRVLQLLVECPQISLQECCRICSVSRAVVQNMLRKGWLISETESLPPESFAEEHTEFLAPGLRPSLTLEQRAVFSALKASLNELSQSEEQTKVLQEHLLFGVTGSGKTEIYLQLAEEICNRDKGVIMLVPEISLTPQMTRRFQQRFGELVAVLHSRLTPRQRFDQWQRLLNGQAKIAIGPRSAIFSPVRNLGLLIVDEEQDTAYCAENHPRYDARTIARMRALLTNSLLLFGSATPSLETYYRTRNGKSTLHTLTKRAQVDAVLPSVHLIDMRALHEQGQFSYLSGELLTGIAETLSRGEQAMILLNRRGYAHAYFCADCGEKLECSNCSVPMTYHHNIGRLVCHYCGSSERLPKRCPHCGSQHLHPAGVGTEQVEKMLGEIFPAARILRMDQDTTATRLGHSKILQQFREKEADILLGTQMIAKGHDFPDVTLMGILGVESTLYSGDYRATERCFQLLTQAAGRAGRAAKRGKVYIQTFQPDEYALCFASQQDYLGFYNEEIRFRKLLDYPPFTQLLQLTVSGEEEMKVIDAIQYLAEDISAFLETRGQGGYKLFNPHRAPLAYLYRRYHWQLFLKCTDVKLLQGLLAYLAQLDFSADLRLTWQLDPA